MNYEAFDLAVVLTAYHNKMATTMPELRSLLDYMCGSTVPLWEIPRARAMCSVSLERHFPWIADYPPPVEATKGDGVGKWVRNVRKDTGYDTLAVPPLRKGLFKPLTLATSMALKK